MAVQLLSVVVIVVILSPAVVAVVVDIAVVFAVVVDIAVIVVVMVGGCALYFKLASKDKKADVSKCDAELSAARGFLSELLQRCGT